MSDPLRYRYCEETLGKDFTDYDLALPGDIVQIPGKLGIFEVLKTENNGDTNYKGVYLGSSPWIVSARSLDKNGLSDEKGQVVMFYQEYKINTEPQTLAHKVCNNLTFISKKGTESRRKLQDIFKEIENKVIENRDNSDSLQSMTLAIEENKQKWLNVLKDPDTSRSSTIRQIFDSEEQVIWEGNQSDETGTKDQVLDQGYLVILETMLDEAWNDAELMKQSSEIAKMQLCRYEVIRGIDHRLEKIKNQLKNIGFD